MIEKNKIELQQKISDLKQAASKLNSSIEIEEFYKNIFGKTGIFATQMKVLKETKDIEGKKFLGSFLNKSKAEILKIINTKKKQLETESMNAEMINRETFPTLIKKRELGYLHPVSLLTERLSLFFRERNFKRVADSPVETEEYNFERLNVTRNHPAFNNQDTFYIDSDKQKRILRAHCTSTTSRELERNANKEFASFTIGEVFRRDTDDSTHSHQFIQLDAVLVKEGLSIKDLKELLIDLIYFVFEKKIDIRFRPSYFPFTTPSFEVDVKCLVEGEHSSSCICKGTKWIELLGGGMLHKDVFNLAGYKETQLRGLAFGMGVDRLVCFLYNIPDIRLLYENRIDFLKQFKRVNK